jgi:hypothetical protein
MMDEWYANMGPTKQQKDIVLKTSIADTGAQCFLLGSNHAIDDKPKHVNPSANAAVAGKTSYKASKVGGTRSDPPEVAGEIIKKKYVTKAAVGTFGNITSSATICVFSLERKLSKALE